MCVVSRTCKDSINTPNLTKHIYWFNFATALSKTVSKQNYLDQIVLGLSTIRMTKN